MLSWPDAGCDRLYACWYYSLLSAHTKESVLQRSPHSAAFAWQRTEVIFHPTWLNFNFELEQQQHRRVQWLCQQRIWETTFYIPKYTLCCASSGRRLKRWKQINKCRRVRLYEQFAPNETSSRSMSDWLDVAIMQTPSFFDDLSQLSASLNSLASECENDKRFQGRWNVQTRKYNDDEKVSEKRFWHFYDWI